ncbi:MAG TPA: coenzyme F420-0:L-glutamate ligase [Actinomycetes bacterium]|nr:coenzyme F420-0:L-glutamate ligase [Actinomycetes bacterium]
MTEMHVVALARAPEVRAGDDLAALLLESATFDDGDIVVIASKVVSKAEGRAVVGRDRTEVISEETVEVVARRGDLQIARTRHGLVMAAAGVDASNVEANTLLPLPTDPDASARRVRATLMHRTGTRIAVVISDTAGRPWRKGQTDIAIGVAGLTPIVDLAGARDLHGNELRVTAPAVADEIAGAAELVMGKAAGTPFARVRGLTHLVTVEDGPGAASIVREVEDDLFRFGSLS